MKEMSLKPPPTPPPRPKVVLSPAVIPKEEIVESQGKALDTIHKLWNTLTKGEPGRNLVKCTYIHTQPITQEGPTCGLVALAMLSRLTPVTLSVGHLLETARSFGYTKHGEMFSSENMTALITSILGEHVEAKHCTGGLEANEQHIISHLDKGNCCLVPYDADKNNMPACLKGHRAHWALLCGFIQDEKQSYVLARQGKSRHVGIWPFKDLHLSNQNLVEISPDKLDENKYILNDIKEGLAGSYITVSIKCQ